MLRKHRLVNFIKIGCHKGFLTKYRGYKVAKKLFREMNMKKQVFWYLCCSWLILMGFSEAGELTVGTFFSDNMVLQRDKAVLLRGSAGPGKVVEVNFNGQTASSKADESGWWSVSLKPMTASSTPQKLEVSSGSEKVSRSNILIGDVLLVGRQTSVDISLGRDASGKKSAKNYVKNDLVRAIVIKTLPSRTPLNDLPANSTAGWGVIDFEMAQSMTGSTFYMAQELANEMKVPLGIVDLNMGHQFPIAWLSREALDQTEKFYGKSNVPGWLKYFETQIAVVYEGAEPPKKFKAIKVPENHALFPAGGHNAVLNPLRGVALKSVLVQLGNDYPYKIYDDIANGEEPFNRSELNRAYVQTYDIRKNGFRMEPVTTPRITREWRQVFGDSELPFGLIAPPGSALNTLGQHHREMRELQRHTSNDLEGVGLIMPGMENITFSSQPKSDTTLGKRSFLWLNGAVYNSKSSASTGPLFEKLEANFSEGTIFFKKGTAVGLKASEDSLQYFEAAGVSGEYSRVKAWIDGETIKIQSETVGRITRVRYNWNKRPNEGLVNEMGLPAFPFRSEDAAYFWFVTNKDDDLPEEYSLPANKWVQSDVTLINGQLKTKGYDNFTGMIGPVGINTGPFGPNMGVREVVPGSPADGKVLVGDVIFGANGKMLGEKAWEVMAEAVTQSESRAGKGKLILSLRRHGKNLNVEIQLKVMGDYSETSPYDCLKTQNILDNLDEWLWENGAGAGFLNYDALYMLATGKPKHLARVRQIVRQKNASRDPNRAVDPKKEGKSWHNSADAILLGEYYMATGDKSVLPHLQHACARIAATQNSEYGGWRQNFPGGATYGLIPNAGLPGVMGFHFAEKAGLEINKEAYEKAIYHYSVGKAETGFLIYGFGKCQRLVPPPIKPQDLKDGKLDSFNGGISSAGVLMDMIGNDRAAHLCSFISSYAWNNTFGGHGGNFWNNFWTPLGAHAHGKEAFIHFWKNHRWYREMNRMFHGGLIMTEGKRLGAATALALVAPRQRLQIVGAPTSPFSIDAPDYLKPALEAHQNGDYDGCYALVQELLRGGSVGKDKVDIVESLGRITLEVKESLKYDEIIKKELSGKKVQDKIKAKGKIEKPVGEWQCLVADIASAGEKAEKGRPAAKLVSEPNQWKMQVVEDMSQAPQGWYRDDFDDSSWSETTLPVSWRMYHTGLLRTTFVLDDPSKIDKLRMFAWVFRQQGIEIYLNGKIIGKVNNLEKKTGNITNEFNDSAVKLLRKGENTLAITTRHNWRWGMLFMKVYNDGFDFNLDGRLAE
jgi:sialate O-acetylesterase